MVFGETNFVGEWKFGEYWNAVGKKPDGKVKTVWTNGTPSHP